MFPLPKTVSEPVSYAIALDADGFTGSSCRVDWCDVRRIVAYKTDLFTGDMICLAFELADGMQLEVTEEDEGWDLLLGTISDRFGVDVDDWWSEVAFPALETNITELWVCNS